MGVFIDSEKEGNEVAYTNEVGGSFHGLWMWVGLIGTMMETTGGFLVEERRCTFFSIQSWETVDRTKESKDEVEA